MKRSLLTLFCLFLVSALSYCYGEDIRVEQTNCKFTISIPSGWTVFKDTLANTNGVNGRVLFASPLIEGAENQPDDYVMISFIPTIKTLNRLSFNQIRRSLKKQYNKQIVTDSIRVTFQGEEAVSFPTSHVSVSLLIERPSRVLECTQVLYPTVLGYISMTFYCAKTKECVSMSDMLDSFENALSIDEEYLYKEAKNKVVFNGLISLLIGLMVYVFVSIALKKKNEE